MSESTMATFDRDQRATAGALQVLESFSNCAQIAFDRILADRAVAEATQAVSGDDGRAWARRLVDAGEALNLRIRYVDCSLREACTFVRQGIPVARSTETADGQLHWSVLTEMRGRKVCWVSLEAEGHEEWMTTRQLCRAINLPSSNSQASWVLGQPALACQAPARSTHYESKDQPLSPLARLTGLIRPEKGDLWVILVFSLVIGVLALATPVAVEALVNTVAFGRYLQPVLVLAVLLFTFLAFAAAMRGLITFIVEILQRRLFIRVVEDLAYRLPRVEQREFDKRHGPEMVNRFFDVVTVQKAASVLLLDGISIVLQTVIGMAVLAFYHPFLLGFDIVLLMFIGFIVFALGRGAVRTAIKESKAKYAVASWLEELARHTTAFKLHSGKQFALERADQLAVNWLDARRTHFHIVIRQILFALGLQALAATALLGLGGWLVIRRELNLGQLVAAELIVMMIVGSFAKLGKHMESFYDMLASVDKLGVLFDLSTEPSDRLLHVADDTAAAVRLCAVTYRYGERPALDSLTLELKAGESVALIGRPGSGKSTLIDLLCGLRSPATGHIELDGIDLRSIRMDSLRDHLAVTRGVEIFQGTVQENVALNRSNVRTRDIGEALAAVGLLDEIQELPEGLNTALQTNGSPLSSSQAERLMLARAVAGRPRLLLIDGTLDALADDLARQVLANLQRVGAWTLVVATGKQTVIESCDRIISLDAATSNLPEGWTYENGSGRAD